MIGGKSSTSLYFHPLFVAWNFFRIFGVLPLKIRFSRNSKRLMEIQFSIGGYVASLFFLGLTLFQFLWSHSFISLPRSKGKDEDKPSNVTLKTMNDKAVLTIFNLVRNTYPFIGTFTAVTARLLGMSVIANGLPLLLKIIHRTDFLLSIPSRYHLINFRYITGYLIISFLIHVSLWSMHFLFLNSLPTLLEQVWEFLSVFNVITAFAMDMQFSLLCFSIRYRFEYINYLLKTFMTREFKYNGERIGIASRIWNRLKNYFEWRNRKIYANVAKTKSEVFEFFSKLDKFNGGALENLSLEIDRKRKQKNLSDTETANVFKSVRLGHILLYDVMQLINELYQLHLLVSVASSLSKILFNIYHIIFGILNFEEAMDRKMNSSEVTLSYLWCGYYIFRFLQLIFFAHYTAVSSREARNIVSKIDSRHIAVSLHQEIEMFSNHLSLRNHEFSACGLFNLNMGLISTSFSTAVTYLVIMLQLK